VASFLTSLGNKLISEGAPGSQVAINPTETAGQLPRRDNPKAALFIDRDDEPVAGVQI
jgi:hypothetical protein